MYNRFEIGEWTYGNHIILSWDEGAKLIIGRFCSISEKVTIFLGGEHRSDWVTTYPFPKIFSEARSIKGHPHTKGNVIIGNDVLIGRGASILSGVKIGDGAIIGAFAVVTKDVAPYSIVAGNPARHIRWRFDERSIEILEKITWWTWPKDKIIEALPMLLNDNIELFIEKYGAKD